MARHRLGDTGEARRCLAEGYRWISEANRRETSDRRETGRNGAASDWAGYDERIIYPLVLREAEELLRTRTPD